MFNFVKFAQGDQVKSLSQTKRKLNNLLLLLENCLTSFRLKFLKITCCNCLFLNLIFVVVFVQETNSFCFVLRIIFDVERFLVNFVVVFVPFIYFLWYSDRERVQEQVKQRTVSLWSYTNSQLSLYQNPLYWAGPLHQLILMPIASMRHIKLWKRLYCRWNPSMRQQVRVHGNSNKSINLQEFPNGINP